MCDGGLHAHTNTEMVSALTPHASVLHNDLTLNKNCAHQIIKRVE